MALPSSKFSWNDTFALVIVPLCVILIASFLFLMLMQDGIESPTGNVVRENRGSESMAIAFIAITGMAAILFVIVYVVDIFIKT